MDAVVVAVEVEVGKVGEEASKVGEDASAWRNYLYVCFRRHGVVKPLCLRKLCYHHSLSHVAPTTKVLIEDTVREKTRAWTGVACAHGGLKTDKSRDSSLGCYGCEDREDCEASQISASLTEHIDTEDVQQRPSTSQTSITYHLILCVV